MNVCMRAVVVLLLVLAGCGRPSPQVSIEHRGRGEPYPQDLVERVAQLPVQHEGRIKPLGTLAAFSLYFIHGRRDLAFQWTDQKEKTTLTPTEWLLDVACQRQQADDYPLFRIENRQVMQAIGMAVDGGQKMDFDYISYAALMPHRDQLAQQAQDAQKREAPDRSPVEMGIIRLWSQVATYEELLGAFAPFTFGFPLESAELKAIYGGKDHVAFAELLQKGSELSQLVQRAAGKAGDPEADKAMRIGGWLADYAQGVTESIAFFPPNADRKRQEKWLTTAELVRPALQGQLDGNTLAMLASLQAAIVGEDFAVVGRGWDELQRLVTAGATARGEQAKVALEADYYRWSLHYKALHWGFLPAFLFAALVWAFPRSRWLWATTMVFSTIGLLLVVGDIALRCWIRNRPPITNLYDTFLFIASVGVGVALVIELINRRRIGLTIAPLLGNIVIMLARKFEVVDGQDTFKQLQAVLDSNYWLATHVTTINTGYAAGMVASLLGTTWLVLGALRVRPDDEAFHKSVVRMTYGATCFGLLFAVVGTILGGVWANDSWGRFWGWDTKENGALMICLAQGALLHMRMGGMVRDFGFCVGAALTGCVVAFSWFHVNQLQVGLHNYGFSEATGQALMVYYITQLVLVLVGAVGRLWASTARTEPSGSASFAE